MGCDVSLVGVAIQAPSHGSPYAVGLVIVGVHVELGRHGSSSPTVQDVTAGGSEGTTGVLVSVYVTGGEEGGYENPGIEDCSVGVAMQAPSHGWPEVELMVGVQIELGRQGVSFPTVQDVGAGAVGAGVAMQAPSQGSPYFVGDGIVGVQVELGRQGVSSPTVQVGRGGCEVGFAMHWPSHGLPYVELMVGVQVEDGRQGVLLPTVQGVTEGGVGVAMH